MEASATKAAPVAGSGEDCSGPSDRFERDWFTSAGENVDCWAEGTLLGDVDFLEPFL